MGRLTKSSTDKVFLGDCGGMNNVSSKLLNLNVI